MVEKIPVQKEFIGEVKRYRDGVEVKKFGSEEVGSSATFLTNDSPIPHYLVTRIDVISEEQGKGFGSAVLSELEDMSRETEIPLVLTDGMHLLKRGQNPHAAGMYDRRPGWIEVLNPRFPDRRRYVFGDEHDRRASLLIDHLRRS